jgi:peroxiredoxin Q/BCP
MSAPQIGKPAPDFDLPATGGRNLRLADFKGHAVILYFYPKDSTPGCTLEGQDFRDLHSAFIREHAVILGISRDDLASHNTFKSEHDFPFELLSDADEKTCRAYDVIKEKNMYGKKVMGIERSTFLIDAGGVLRREWRKVKVQGHAEEVLDAVKSLD